MDLVKMSEFQTKPWLLYKKLFRFDIIIHYTIFYLKGVKHKIKMNALSIVFGVVAIVAVASAQEGSCGCAPQPTVIQLSCGGNNQPSYLPPPPPPAFGPAPPAWAPAPAPSEDGLPFPYPPTNMEEYEFACKFDNNGYPISHPPGGFPEGFRLIEHPDGSIEPVGFHPHEFGGVMPQPGTPQFNMIMCTPIPVPVI